MMFKSAPGYVDTASHEKTISDEKLLILSRFRQYHPREEFPIGGTRT